MTPIEISNEQARNFLIRYHGLDQSGTFCGEQGILLYLERVGCIQYDPLDVVGRNADLVLQSRVPGYTGKMLDKLLYSDRALMDGWDKMMSIYRTDDWPYFSRIRKMRDQELQWLLERRSSLQALELTQDIRGLLKEKGPLQSAQIKMGSTGTGRWGHRNLSGAAMDYMFNVGEIGVSEKKGTQKVYDLVENLLPKELLDCPDPFTSDHDFYKWYFRRRVGSMGLLWDRNGGGWLGFFLSDKSLRASVLDELVEEKKLTAVSVEDSDETFYIRSEDLSLLDAKPSESDGQVRFLAPLDNLLWDRDMIDRLFHFKYSWEVYLPAEKRKYGYYVLPVLYGNQLVARFEPEKVKAGEPLKIKQWWWEDGIKVNSQMKKAVAEAFKRFAKYLGTSFEKGSKIG